MLTPSQALSALTNGVFVKGCSAHTSARGTAAGLRERAGTVKIGKGFRQEVEHKPSPDGQGELVPEQDRRVWSQEVSSKEAGLARAHFWALTQSRTDIWREALLS